MHFLPRLEGYLRVGLSMNFERARAIIARASGGHKAGGPVIHGCRRWITDRGQAHLYWAR